jgi:hypothetical protein
MKEPLCINEKFILRKDGNEIELNDKEQKELYEVLKRKFDKGIDYTDLLKKVESWKDRPSIVPNTNPYIQTPTVLPNGIYYGASFTLNGVSLGSSEGDVK